LVLSDPNASTALPLVPATSHKRRRWIGMAAVAVLVAAAAAGMAVWRQHFGVINTDVPAVYR
jgi:hypothetical protein